MQYANKVLYNLPNDILEKICYKNNYNRKQEFI